MVAGVCSVSNPLMVYISVSPGIFKLHIDAYECSRNAPQELIQGCIPDNVSWWILKCCSNELNCSFSVCGSYGVFPTLHWVVLILSPLWAK